MSSTIYEWEATGHRYQLHRWGTRCPGWNELPPYEARWVVQAQLAKLDGRRNLYRQLASVLRGTLPSDIAEPGVLERVLEQRLLIVLSQPLPLMNDHSTPAKRADEPPLGLDPRRERAWIDITVIDDSMPPRPLIGTQFRLTLPGNSRRAGALDSAGHLRVEEIESGQCILELLEVRSLKA